MPYFLSQFMAAFNDNFYRAALVTLITFKMTAYSSSTKALLVSLVLGLFELPYFFLSAIAGQCADKYDKARVIRAIKLAEIVIIAFGMYSIYIQNINMCLLTMFLMGIKATFFGPVKYSILPCHLKENELLGGNGLVEAGTFLAILIGLIAGGQIINFTIITLVIMSVAIAGFIASLKIPSNISPAPDLKLTLNPIKETFKNIKYLRQENPKVFTTILGISWFWLVGAYYISELPVVVEQIIHGGPSILTFLVAMFTLGIATGSLYCNKLLKEQVNVNFVPVSVFLLTLFIFDMSRSGSYFIPISSPDLSLFFQQISSYRLILDVFGLAFVGGVYVVPLYAFMQTHSDSKHISRIVAVNSVINSIFMEFLLSQIVTKASFWYFIQIKRRPLARKL